MYPTLLVLLGGKRETFYSTLPTWDGQFCVLFLARLGAEFGLGEERRRRAGEHESERGNERRHEDLWPELRRVSRIFSCLGSRERVRLFGLDLGRCE